MRFGGAERRTKLSDTENPAQARRNIFHRTFILYLVCTWYCTSLLYKVVESIYYSLFTRVFFLYFTSINIFSTAVPIWGQTTLIPSYLSPKRDWGPKRVNINRCDGHKYCIGKYVCYRICSSPSQSPLMGDGRMDRGNGSFITKKQQLFFQ